MAGGSAGASGQGSRLGERHAFMRLDCATPCMVMRPGLRSAIFLVGARADRRPGWRRDGPSRGSRPLGRRPAHAGRHPRWNLGLAVGFRHHPQARQERSRGACAGPASSKSNSIDTEAALTAEPHILIIWQGRDGPPEQIIGDMRGTARVPSDTGALLDFARLARARIGGDASGRDRQNAGQGTPFNIGIRTLDEELLEADGRTAGGLTTLRLRPLAGERRQITELAYDARKPRQAGRAPERGARCGALPGLAARRPKASSSGSMPPISRRSRRTTSMPSSPARSRSSIASRIETIAGRPAGLVSAAAMP